MTPIFSTTTSCSFCARPRLVGQPPNAGLETTHVEFFGPEELPPLSRKRVLEADIAAAFAHAADPGLAPLFD